MAELAALGAGAGLASSIITFIEFSVKFGKLVKDVAKTQGGLPRELEECQEDINAITAWLGEIQRLGSDGGSNGELLKNAIRRCTETSNELIRLLETLGASARVQNISLVGKTKVALGHVKRAGKIHWKKDQIALLRDKLRIARDDVHACLASSTNRDARRIFNGQLQIGVGIQELSDKLTLTSGDEHQVKASVQELNDKFNGALDRLYNLELQCQQITMQNHQIMNKMNILLERRHGRVSVLAVAFDYLPQRPLITSTLEGILYAATAISTFKVISNALPVPEDFINALVRRRAMQIASIRNTTTIDVVVSLGRTPIAKLPTTFHGTPQPVTKDFTIAKALRDGNGVSGRLNALKTTTRVILAVFSQKDGYLPLLDSTEMQSMRETQGMSAYQISPPLIGDSYFAEPLKYEEIETLAKNSLYGDIHRDVDHRTFSGSQLVLFIEMKWSITAIAFSQLCLLASLTRLGTIYGYIDDGYDSQFLILPLWITLITLLDFLESHRKNINKGSIPRAIMSLVKEDPLASSVHVVATACVMTELLVLRHNENLLFPLLSNYLSILAIVTSIYQDRHTLTFPRAVWSDIWLHMLQRHMLALNQVGINLTLGKLSALDISQNLSPGHFAIVAGAAFYLVSICHNSIVFADGTTSTKFLELFYALCMAALVYIENAASTWPFYLGTSILQLLTGSWLTRRWLQRRGKAMWDAIKRDV